MANIWMNKKAVNNENSQYAVIKSKNVLASTNCSVKKQVFGELKNVIHNQITSTPFKGNAAKIDGLPGALGATKSLCNDVLRKQQMKQNLADAQNKLNKRYKKVPQVAPYKEPEFVESLFDSWDWDRKCCKEQKTDAEIWSEMNMLNINLAGFQFDSDNDGCKGNELLGSLDLADELEPLAPSFFDFHEINEVGGSCMELPNMPKLPDDFHFIDDLPF